MYIIERWKFFGMKRMLQQQQQQQQRFQQPLQYTHNKKNSQENDVQVKFISPLDDIAYVFDTHQ